MSAQVFFGKPPESLSKDVVRLSWSEIDSLTVKEAPEKVLLPSDQVTEQGAAVEKILALCSQRKIPVSLYSDRFGDYEKVLGALLGLPSGVPPEFSPSTARREEAFRTSGPFLLGQAFGRLNDLKELLVHLRKVLEIYAELSVVVFSLRVPSQTALFLCVDPRMTTVDLEYFLRFCKQDVIVQDRFVDLETLNLHYLTGRPRKGSIESEGAASYVSFPLQDANGSILGLIHLGSAKNHYFNETVLSRLTPLLPSLGLAISLAVRKKALAERKTGLLALFAKFLPEPIIRKLLEERRRTQDLVGKKTRAVILFSDIRSFTSITERNGAEPVVRFLNRHFQAMVRLISDQGGVVDKFIGDAIVAVFDADAEDACERAARAARNMLRELPRVDVSSVILDGGRYGIGVGLHVGEAVAGYIGSREKTAYTVVGDIIEHAEALEAETKHYRVGVLMSHAVASSIRDKDLRPIDVTEDKTVGADEHLYTLDMA